MSRTATSLSDKLISIYRRQGRCYVQELRIEVNLSPYTLCISPEYSVIQVISWVLPRRSDTPLGGVL